MHRSYVQVAALPQIQNPAMVRNAVYEEAPSMFDDDGDDNAMRDDHARQVGQHLSLDAICSYMTHFESAHHQEASMLNIL